MSLIWTGYPQALQAQSLSGNWPLPNLPQIYAYATLGTLLFTWLGGRIADRISPKTGTLGSLSVAAILLAVLSRLPNPFWALTLLPLVYFNFSFGVVMEAVWLLRIDSVESLSDPLVNRSTYLIAAKLLGFALGPFFFLQSGAHSLWICVAIFILSLCILSTLPSVKPHSLLSQSPKDENTSSLATTQDSRWLAAAAILTGLTTVPLNPILAEHFISFQGPGSASLFWAVAGVAAIFGVRAAGHWPLQKFSGTPRVFLYTCAVSSCSAALGVTHWPIFLLLVALGISASLYFSMGLQVHALEGRSSSLGRRFGNYTFLVDLGTFLGMLGSAAAPKAAMIWLVASALSLRLLSVRQALQGTPSAPRAP